MIFSNTPIGDLRINVEVIIQARFPEAIFVDGIEGDEGWSINIALPVGTDKLLALSDTLQLLNNLSLPPDTFILDEEQREHYVFQDKKHNRQEYKRLIYMKLPLLQPRFHWQFTEKNKLLEGELKLVVTIN